MKKQALGLNLFVCNFPSWIIFELLVQHVSHVSAHLPSGIIPLKQTLNGDVQSSHCEGANGPNLNISGESAGSRALQTAGG